MVLFFYGPNSYASRRRLQELVATYVRKAGSDFGLERIDGATANLRQIEAALQTVPFLANSRLVVIEGLGRNKSAGEGIERLTSNVPDTTVVVFYEMEVDKRTSYFKTLTKLAKAVDHQNLTAPQLVSWADAEVKKLGCTADRAALTRLVELVGDDQWRLSMEIGKLTSYAPHLTREAVEDMVEPSFNETIFALTEAITSGRVEVAAKLYTGLVSDKTNEIYILTMLTWQARNLLLAKTAPAMSEAELAKSTGMSPYVAGKSRSAAAKFSEATLSEMMLATIDTEYQIKSGLVQMNLAVEQLVFRLASRSARHPA